MSNMIGTGWQLSSEEDFDNIFGGDSTDTEPEVEVPEVEGVEEEEVVAPVSLKTEQDFDDNFEGEETPEEEEVVPETKPKPKATSKVKEPEVETPEKANNLKLLKATAEYKAQKYGIEIEEDIEWDEETFAELEDHIDEIRLAEKYNGLKQSNEFIEALFNVAENDGDVSDLLTLLQQRQELTSIDTSTIEGKSEMVEKYYRDVEGKDPAWIKKQMRLLNSGEDTAEMEEEYKLVKSLYEKHLEKEKNESVTRSAQAKQARQQAIERKKVSFSSSLENKSFDKKQTNELTDFVFNDKKVVLNNGESISGFDARLRSVISNPEELADLALYLKDKDLFKKRIITESKNITNTQKFKSVLDKQPTGAGGGGIAAPKEKKTQFTFITG